MTKEQKLTPKQDLFVRYYTGECNFNGTDAARRAGYKGDAHQLTVISAQNLAKLSVKTAVDKIKAERHEEIEVTAQWIVEQAKVLPCL